MKICFTQLLKSKGLFITDSRLKLLNALSNFNEYVSVSHLSLVSRVEIRSTYNVLTSLLNAGILDVEEGKSVKYKIKEEYK